MLWPDNQTVYPISFRPVEVFASRLAVLRREFISRAKRMTTYEQIAKDAGFLSYTDYLRSDHWKNLKESKGIRINCCCVCQSSKMLLAHHIRYRNLLDVTVKDLAVMCYNCHTDFHLACKRDGIDYLEKEIPEIVDITNRFRTTDYAIRRADKIERRARMRMQRNSLTSKQSTKKLQQRFKVFLKSPRNHQDASQLCDWLMKLYG